MPVPGALFKPVQPTPGRPFQIDQFREFVNTRHHLSLETPWQLHAWSVDHRASFWDAVWDFNGLIGDKGNGPLFVDGPLTDTKHRLPNARLNYTENLLCSHPNARSDRIALHSVIEDGVIKSLSWADLYDEVHLASDALRKLGVGPGDRVAAYTANNAEAVIMLLATLVVGAVWSATPCEFGVEATLDRLDQIGAKVLLVSDRYRYGGKTIDVRTNISHIAAALYAKAGLKTVVCVGQLEKDRQPRKMPTCTNVTTLAWNAFLDLGRGHTSNDICFWRGPAMAPIYILFSSGTTGKPKCILHHAGGVLLSHAVGQGLHGNMGPDDAFLMFTTFGWMMSVFYVASLQKGVTVVAYDGSPLRPIGILWDLVEKLKLTTLGISPRYLQTLIQSNYSPLKKHNLSSLRYVLTTGAPLTLEHHDFVRDHIGQDVFLFNGCGGTDVCNHHICGCVALPHHYGEIQMPMLGSKIECWDDSGHPLPAGREGFWNDPGDKLYFKSYYEAFPGKTAWNQGDWIIVGPTTGGFQVLGRSDGVLNPSGVRFGSGEIYAIVDRFPEVANSLAVGQRFNGDERVLLFIELAPGAQLDSKLQEALTKAIITGLSRRHVPAMMIACPKIPMTSNGKRQEVAVKKILNGARLDQVNADPETLKWFLEQPELWRKPIKSKL